MLMYSGVLFFRLLDFGLEPSTFSQPHTSRPQLKFPWLWIVRGCPEKCTSETLRYWRCPLQWWCNKSKIITCLENVSFMSHHFVSIKKGLIALFDMIEFYEAATHVSIASNKNMTSRGWQACCRMIKRVWLFLTYCLLFFSDSRLFCFTDRMFRMAGRSSSWVIGTQFNFTGQSTEIQLAP